MQNGGKESSSRQKDDGVGSSRYKTFLKVRDRLYVFKMQIVNPKITTKSLFNSWIAKIKKNIASQVMPPKGRAIFKILSNIPYC